MYEPKPHIRTTAHVKSLDEYRALYDESLRDPSGFWLREAAALDWFRAPEAGLEGGFEGLDVSWFAGGKVNACHNCVDRHARATPDRVALIWARNEPGKYDRITFAELRREVSRLANVLLAHGVRKGDRVCLYMPMIPELAYAVLACARIGAVHSVVFAGFSADALRGRVVAARAAVVLTANEGLRGDKTIPLKRVVDEAVEGLSAVRSVLVARRTARDVPMEPGRDHWLDAEMAKQRPVCPVTWMDAEDPLFLLYTSGSTGQPKGLVHTTGGYLTFVASTFRWVFDARPGDVHLCTADLGWITGHSYVLYGPLANGVATVLFESTPTWPDAGRLWQVVDDVGATICYTAPTALRSLMRAGDEPVKRASRSTLRVLGSVGEPINPEAWTWFHDVVGEGRCAVVDTWWQTETGGILIAPLPGATPAAPGSATLPLPGVRPVLVDEDGRELEGNGVRGNLCIAGSWPGQARTLHGDHERFREAYFARFPGRYFTGDGCERDANGYYWITGRVDDVLNVSGHRIGTAEVESALVAHEAVAEAAVVGFPHPVKGTGIRAYVVVGAHYEADDPDLLAGALREQVRRVIGPIASPDQVVVVPGLPKTRSGKVMRRILRKIAEGQRDELGDLSTLADPHVVDEILTATSDL